jgi:hypothetical protein
MTRLRTFLDRVPGSRRPPTGPLTIDEERRAEALRQSTHDDDEPIERGAEEDSDQQSN